MSAISPILLVNNNVLSTSQFYWAGLSILQSLGTFGTALYTVQVLGPDGATWQSTTLTASAAGITSTPVSLPSGRYQLVLTSGSGNTGVYIQIASIPTNID
jgi:hypothetical protein